MGSDGLVFPPSSGNVVVSRTGFRVLQNGHTQNSVPSFKVTLLAYMLAYAKQLMQMSPEAMPSTWVTEGSSTKGDQTNPNGRSHVESLDAGHLDAEKHGPVLRALLNAMLNDILPVHKD
jgi:hypothetical protein